MSTKSLIGRGFQAFVRSFFEGKKGWQDNITVMLNSFQHLMFACTGNKEIPKQPCIQAHSSSLRCGGSLCKVRNDNRGAAFTLAEVLITLVIIGVIAALTLPTLIGKYQKHQTVVGLKKAYSEINNAVRMSVAENGDVSTWTWELDEAWINKYILPYFKIANTMTMQEAKQKAGGVYYGISGDTLQIGILSIWPAKVITLPSGAQVWLGLPADSKFMTIFAKRYEIYVDLNGSKKPNTFGKDVFHFSLWRNYGKVLLTNICDGNTEPVTRTIDQLKNGNPCPNLNYGCNKNGRGMWCGALIQAEGWEIKDDYPW